MNERHLFENGLQNSASPVTAERARGRRSRGHAPLPIESLETRFYLGAHHVFPASVVRSTTGVPADLAASIVKMPDQLLPAGEQGLSYVTVRVDNPIGSVPYEGPVDVSLFASIDQILGNDDESLGNASRRMVLGSGKAGLITVALRGLPAGLPDGEFYIVGQVEWRGDAVADAVSTSTVEIAPPSITFSRISYLQPDAEGGGPFTTTVIVKDSGSTEAIGDLPIALYAWSLASSSPPITTASSTSSSSNSSVSTSSSGATTGSATTSSSATGSTGSSSSTSATSTSTSATSTTTSATSTATTGGSTSTSGGTSSNTSGTATSGSAATSTTALGTTSSTTSSSSNSFVPLTIKDAKIHLRPGQSEAIQVNFITPQSFPSGAYWLVGQMFPTAEFVQVAAPPLPPVSFSGPTASATNVPDDVSDGGLLLFSTSTFTLFTGGAASSTSGSGSTGGGSGGGGSGAGGGSSAAGGSSPAAGSGASSGGGSSSTGSSGSSGSTSSGTSSGGGSI